MNNSEAKNHKSYTRMKNAHLLLHQQVEIVARGCEYRIHTDMAKPSQIPFHTLHEKRNVNTLTGRSCDSRKN